MGICRKSKRNPFQLNLYCAFHSCAISGWKLNPFQVYEFVFIFLVFIFSPDLPLLLSRLFVVISHHAFLLFLLRKTSIFLRFILRLLFLRPTEIAHRVDFDEYFFWMRLICGLCVCVVRACVCEELVDC